VECNPKGHLGANGNLTMQPLPPKGFLTFFRWYCHPRLIDHIEGDLIENYRHRLRKGSKTKADLKFILDVLLLFRPGIIRPRHGYETLNPYDMYKNYFKIAFRVFDKERMYSLINVGGLALGFTCCLLIYLFVNDELSYDKFHVNADRIYRISSAYMRQGRWEPYASNSWRTAELIGKNYPEVEELVRIMPDNGEMFEYSDKRILETRIAWVDDNFLRVFNFPIIKGNSQNALKGPNKVVITESVAQKYFGNEDPVDKVFKVDDSHFELQVSGVMRDMPSNSHFHFDFLISGETLRQVVPEDLYKEVGWDSQRVYAKLAAGTDIKLVETTFPAFIDKNLDYLKSSAFKLFFQPLLSIHLESNIGSEFESNGSTTRIYTFSVIALFILIIACVNYMNLTTAKSLRRAKEVGVRKVMGAKRPDLFGQFLIESFLMTGVALVIALTLFVIVLPDFNQFAGKAIPRAVILNPQVAIGLLLSFTAIGLITGLYPAAMLSSFNPMNTMKKVERVGWGGFVLRRGLVVVQFIITISLIAASAVVFNQWNFMKTKSLGVNDDMIVSVPLQTMDRHKVDAMTHSILANAAITKAGYSNLSMPGWIRNSTVYRAQDVNVDNEVNKSMKVIRIDDGFFQTIEAEIVEGRNFSRNWPADSGAIMLNQSALVQLGWKEGVGKWMEVGQRRYTVVGVVKDFHFESLHRKIPPTIFLYQPLNVNYAYLKLAKNNIALALSHIQQVFSEFEPKRDFTYTFMREDVERQYESEEKFTQVFSMFTALAIIIACLGTFGLISFTAERKSKEIGIRKVLGASVGNVSFMLIREFVFLLIVASIIAWPVTFYFLNGWMDGFIYRISINAVPFVLATVLATIIVVLTTGFRAFRAALANPVESLRSE
jgi:putative ABC transport system permease protein